MDISHMGPRLLNLGLTQVQVNELKEAAAKLPPRIEDGTLMPIPQLPGLTLDESELLVARFLDRLATELGLPVDDPSLYDDLGWPTLEELMKKAQKYEESNQVGLHERA
jgi:hypothetical protein